MIFQAGNVHESASLFNLKEKTIDLTSHWVLNQQPRKPGISCEPPDHPGFDRWNNNLDICKIA